MSKINPVRIFIQDLAVKIRIGVSQKERAAKQNILLNISVWADISLALKTKDIKDTVSYSDLQREIVSLAAAKPYRLLENLLDDISRALFKDSRIRKVLVSAAKPGKLAGSRAVGVELEKTR